MIDWELKDIYLKAGGVGAETVTAVTTVWKCLFHQMSNILQKYSHLLCFFRPCQPQAPAYYIRIYVKYGMHSIPSHFTLLQLNKMQPHPNIMRSCKLKKKKNGFQIFFKHSCLIVWLFKLLLFTCLFLIFIQIIVLITVLL